eukprot:TRINITY_DN6114_c0_g1_i1.p1 TRINITY_DN6114_c0_g1~~TRINITY_DN6114_c0_g1_i1.p1  ORF type:complete len:365 (+),score=83.33 TRINITY_DN6114_c0_g1_i1:37-1131(+)
MCNEKIEFLDRQFADLVHDHYIKDSEHNVNRSNVECLCPFRPEICGDKKVLHVENSFWEELLNEDMKDGILTALGGGWVVEQASTWSFPNTIIKDTAERSIFRTVYETYLGFFDYDRWCRRLTLRDLGIDAAHDDNLADLITPTRTSDRQLFCSIGKSRVITGHGLSDEAFEDFSPTIVETIQRAIDKWGAVFVKLSSKSAKNDVKLRPLTTVRGVLDTLTASKDIMAWLEGSGNVARAADLVLLPWNPCITEDNEYRVFMKQGEPTAISQQRWYHQIPDPLSPDMVVSAVRTLCTTLQPRLPFPSATLDVWINPSTSTAHLIECNPWGGFFSSGSSLFDWEQHWDMMHDTKIVSFARLTEGSE